MVSVFSPLCQRKKLTFANARGKSIKRIEIGKAMIILFSINSKYFFVMEDTKQPLLTNCHKPGFHTTGNILEYNHTMSPY
jgi:hypothetical protein